MRPLYKTTIVIWTEDDPGGYGLSNLAHDAESGDAYCSLQECVLVPAPEKDLTWDGTEFFDDPAGDTGPMDVAEQCPHCGEAFEQQDTDGGRCTKCGRMIVATHPR